MATTASPLSDHTMSNDKPIDPTTSANDATQTPAAAAAASVLRQRKATNKADSDAYRADDEGGDADDKKNQSAEEVTWGKTPSGVVFRVPETHSFVHTLMNTFFRSSFTRWTTISLAAQPALFFMLSNWPTLRSFLFLVYFAFWRGCYDFGFAWLLRQQSERKYVVRTLREWGWLDVNSESGGEEGREWAKWWKVELEMKMGEGYTWDSVPAEYNSWLIFRQLVDIVLLNDFVSYSLFAWANLNFPSNQGILTHIFRWVFGWSLIVFNLWVKIDAHRVVKDYAWYWGDAFWLMVMQHDLVFDGVYEIAPHPMYSVGYAGYYGLSIVVGSYSVLFVSLAAHAAQFAFLLWFENPHIDRTYGGEKKPLAARIPLDLGVPSSAASAFEEPATESNLSLAADAATPAATEGETASEPEVPELPEQAEPTGIQIGGSYNSSVSASMDNNVRRRRAMSTTMHDITHRFFRKPTVIFKRFDPFRASDFALAVLVSYAIVSLVPALPHSIGLFAHFCHALSWRLFHSYGLGLLLRAQSKTKWMVRHYLHNYPYPGEEVIDEDEEIVADKSVVKRATEEAFSNWQVLYNTSLVMTYVSFAGLAWKTYHLPADWTVSGTILRHVLGALLIALQVWSSTSIQEVLGDFGWFYSDFFLIEQVPARLAYTGIYRFLNNPERTLGGAAFLGLALISNSSLVFFLALFSHLSHWWFLSFVEAPHMKRLYGDRLRKDGGLTKTVKNIAGKTLANKKSIPELRRYVDEVRDTLDKVEVKVGQVVEDLIQQAGPRLNILANDTKKIFQQSRERMTVTRVAKDISNYDTSRYSITVASSSSSAPVPRFHVGQPIRVNWTAPSNHSRKDWIGIYRVGSCKSKLITKVSSVGKWVPIFEEEYNGEDQVGIDPEEQVSYGDAGICTFRGKRLPWAPGQYELRYHHDGKHNVMSIISPIEIYVSQPDIHSFRAVHDTLLNIVCLALDSNVSLVPRSARQMARNQAKLGHTRAGSSASAAGVFNSSSNPLASRTSAQALGASGANTPSRSGAVPTSPPSLAPTIAELAAELAGTTDSDSASSPPQSEHPGLHGTDDSDTGLQDSDDFVIMDEEQAKHISQMVDWAFKVDLSSDVVVADANVTALAKRVLGAHNLVHGLSSYVEGS